MPSLSNPAATTSNTHTIMSTTPAIRKSRWESDEDDEDLQERKRKETPKKKQKKQRDATPSRSSIAASPSPSQQQQPARAVLRPPPRPAFTQPPFLTACRHVDEYERLNRIEEGSYGIVYRARDRQTGDIVALKKLKLEKEKNGFPVTSLREIFTLMNAKHPNIVNVREVVMGNHLDQ